MRKADNLLGTLDLLVLRILAGGDAIHGCAIADLIHDMSRDALRVEEGSLYPALHRMELKGWVAASWELSDKGKQAKYYKLTPLGKKQLAAEQSKWDAFARAMGLILNPVDQEGQ